jgi:hypothetical protein
MGDACLFGASLIHNISNMKRRISLLVALLFLVGTGMTLAQETLYNAYWNSKGYVVGAKLSQSGLHRWEGDTTWTHLGWNTPQIGRAHV